MKNPSDKKDQTGIQNRKPGRVRTVIWDTVKWQKWLSAGIFCAVAGAVVVALLPPLILGKIVDMITAGRMVELPNPSEKVC